jgi:hypothetical protein
MSDLRTEFRMGITLQYSMSIYQVQVQYQVGTALYCTVLYDEKDQGSFLDFRCLLFLAVFVIGGIDHPNAF